MQSYLLREVELSFTVTVKHILQKEVIIKIKRQENVSRKSKKKSTDF